MSHEITPTIRRGRHMSVAAPHPPRVAIRPEPIPSSVESAAIEGGAEIVGIEDAEALLWSTPGRSDELFDVLAAAPSIRWVHVRFAGVDAYAQDPRIKDGRVWTCGKGGNAEPVAQHAFALSLAALRDLPKRARATTWGRSSGRSLLGAHVTILGAGGIAEWLARYLGPFDVDLTVVRRTVSPFRGAVRTLTADRLDEALPNADLVVVALPLTLETVGIIAAAQLQKMESHAWLINVSRGSLVVTDDLLTALAEEWIGGAALDVTDPEPLPDGHPLWSSERCLITPHSATSGAASNGLTARIVDNVRLFGAGEPLLGLVDVEAGY
jgi:phosphoglycerate dehydrogenase-like enzyme